MTGPMIPKDATPIPRLSTGRRSSCRARPASFLDHRQLRGLGHRQADGATLLPAPTGVPLMPDVVHWGFHEYGMRVGCWRFFELFKRLGIKPTLAANARICEDYPRVAGQARDDGWEFMGHAYEQGPIHKEADQAGMITAPWTSWRNLPASGRSAGSAPV